MSFRQAMAFVAFWVAVGALCVTLQHIFPGTVP